MHSRSLAHNIHIGAIYITIKLPTCRKWINEMENIEELILCEFPSFKRYYVFSYYQYYPDGGIDDVLKRFNNKDDAMKYAKECSEKSYDYVYIHDVIENHKLKFK